MTAQDYQYEQYLRAQTREKGARDAAQILADFYEQLGQPSRAALWRGATRVYARRKVPADLVVQDPQWQRKVMMWLLGHVTSYANVSRAFRSTYLGHDVEQKICSTANDERHHPTMAATLRLQAAGALPKPYVQGSFTLGECPPDHWPHTRLPRDWRARDQREWAR